MVTVHGAETDKVDQAHRRTNGEWPVCCSRTSVRREAMVRRRPGAMARSRGVGLEVDVEDHIP